MRKLLLTAFVPFGGHTINASQEVARGLKDHGFASAQIEVLELPVERFLAPKTALEALDRLRPDIVVLLGEAWGRALITPERVAINIDDFRIPDNAGNCPREESVIEGGPAAYFSTLPLMAIQTALKVDGIASAISNTAGTYLCNHLFYHVMHHLNQTGNPALAGFIHIPVFSEASPTLDATKSQEPGAIISKETVMRGVRVAIETCLRVGA